MTDYPTILREATLPDKPGNLPAVLVLRDFGPTRPHRYVTHQGNRSGDKALDGYYWGHYFDDYYEANADFKQRCADKGVAFSAFPGVDGT